MYLESFISSLLFEAEGTELDFKREQYLFEGVDDKSKSELLKDILAFANAWRRSDAYILIGIQEKKEGESEVVGISTHVDDAQLQQFVNSKTNRPMVFSYTPVAFRGRQIGVIRIPLQERPIYLRKDFGKLRANVVYLRRGSATAEANPDEVARMGQSTSETIKQHPILVARFSIKPDWREFIDQAKFETVRLLHPEISKLPDYSPDTRYGEITFNQPNRNFYRDRAEYVRCQAKLRPIRLVLCNEGSALASGTKLVLEIEDPEHEIELRLESGMPEKPVSTWSMHDQIVRYPNFNKSSSCGIEISETKAGWSLEMVFGKVLAKDHSKASALLFLGVNKSTEIIVRVRVFAEELSEPVLGTLLLNFVVSDKELSTENLTR